VHYKLSTPRPLILRAQFHDATRFVDHLNLSQRVNARLREVSVRGTPAPFVFVDAATAPEAYIVAGRYTLRGDELILEVRLVKQDEEVGQWTMVGSAHQTRGIDHQLVGESLGFTSGSSARTI
jgi:hypothetical protein